MTVLTNTKCEWNGKLQFSTGESDKDLFTITADADCTAVIKVGSSSGSKTSGKVNALKLGSTVIYDFDTKDSKDATEKTVSLKKGANTFSGSGVCILKVTLSASTTPTTPPATGDSGTTTTGSGSSGSGDTTGTGTSGGTTTGDGGNGASDDQKATAKTYDFTDLPLSAFVGLSDWTANAKLTDDVTSITTSAGSVAVKKGSGLKTNVKKSEESSKKTKFIQYDGGLKSDFTSATTIDPSSDRYLAVTVDGKGTVTANVAFVGDTTLTSKLQAVFVDKDGKKLGEVVECENKTADEITKTITASVEEKGTVVYLLFSRNGEVAKGSLRVTTIEVKP